MDGWRKRASEGGSPTDHYRSVVGLVHVVLPCARAGLLVLGDDQTGEGRGRGGMAGEVGDSEHPLAAAAEDEESLPEKGDGVEESHPFVVVEAEAKRRSRPTHLEFVS